MILLYFYVHIIILCVIFAYIIIWIIMALYFNTKIDTPYGYVKTTLQVYFFEEEGDYIAYCPSLRLLSVGKDRIESQKEFYNVFYLYITHGLEHGTLRDDLINHGWEIDDNGKLTAPSEEYMLRTNRKFREIKYVKKCKPILIDVDFPHAT